MFDAAALEKPSAASPDSHAAVLDAMLRQLRQEPMAPRRLHAILDQLAGGLPADGAAIMDPLASEPDMPLHRAGWSAPPPNLPASLAGLAGQATELSFMGATVLAIPLGAMGGGLPCLCAWRAATAPAWSPREHALLAAAAALACLLLDHLAVERELARQSRTDALTGLLNRRAFLEDAERRIDRLDRDSRPGALLLLDLDGLRRLNAAGNHSVGDAALLAMARVLRGGVRGTDLVARLGGGEFALWLDGSDELAAAERAERFRMEAPTALAQALPPGVDPVTLSAGLAERHPLYAETLEEVMRRARQALAEAKLDGGGAWRVRRAT